MTSNRWNGPEVSPWTSFSNVVLYTVGKLTFVISNTHSAGVGDVTGFVGGSDLLYFIVWSGAEDFHENILISSSSLHRLVQLLGAVLVCLHHNCMISNTGQSNNNFILFIPVGIISPIITDSKLPPSSLFRSAIKSCLKNVNNGQVEDSLMSVFPVQLKFFLFFFLNQGKLSRKPLVKGYNNYIVADGRVDAIFLVKEITAEEGITGAFGCGG